MAKIYAFKEARGLIDKYEDIFNELSKVPSAIEKHKINIIRQAEILLNQKFFQNKQMEDFNLGQASEINYIESYSLISLMYCYFEGKKIAEHSKILCESNQSFIKENIDQLGKGKNALYWLFSSKEDKNNAIDAYNNLNGEQCEKFYINAVRLITKLNSLNAIERDIVLEDVRKNELKYKRILFELKPDLIEKEPKTDEIINLKKQYNELMSELNILEDSGYKAKSEIKEAIDKLIAEEVLNILRNIPLDELNRDKNGIRVKTLIDWGYKNIADVYIASRSQLASVQGISYSAAYEIKSIANKIVEGATKNVKIKLSIDNKTKVATQIVSAIYKYNVKKTLIDEKKEIIKSESNNIEAIINQLKEVENGIKYYFSDLKDKKQYFLKYAYLKNAIEGNGFGNKARRILKENEELKKLNQQEAWSDFESKTVEYYNTIEKICPGVLGNDDFFYGLPERLARKIQEESFFPEGLLCTLRQYQELGVKYILHQKRVLLGDEMGLGKTIQAIAAMVSLRNTGATHFIVVCPASVVVNWCREICKHSKLIPTMIHSKTRKSALKSWLKTGGVAVTTFETVQHIDLEENYKYSLLVVDEAHYIKNPNALRTRNTIKLSEHAERMLFMTGTALENNVHEMINLIEILNPKIAGEIENIAYLSTAPKFREKIAPVYYRRKREDVLTELPELIECKEWCRMTEYEEEIYENTVLYGSYPEARRLSWHIDDLKHSSKASRLKELIELAKNEERKVIIFSFFLDTIQKIAELLKNECIGVITGAINSEKRQNIIDEFDHSSPGSVIVSQILAGGTGLNIQSASVVIICEPQLKPSIENQAISRAYRMGQARNVIVYRLLCENTIDEKVINLLEEKQEIFNAFADKSVAAEKTLEIEEKAFGEIIKEEIRRITEKRSN